MQGELASSISGWNLVPSESSRPLANLTVLSNRENSLVGFHTDRSHPLSSVSSRNLVALIVCNVVEDDFTVGANTCNSLAVRAETHLHYLVFVEAMLQKFLL